MVKNRNFVPKLGVNDHKTCHVKFHCSKRGHLNLWCSFRLLGEVHNCNYYIFKDIVFKHTATKFD